MSQPCRNRVALSTMSLLVFAVACSSQMQLATSSAISAACFAAFAAASAADTAAAAADAAVAAADTASSAADAAVAVASLRRRVAAQVLRFASSMFALSAMNFLGNEHVLAKMATDDDDDDDDNDDDDDDQTYMHYTAMQYHGEAPHYCICKSSHMDFLFRTCIGVAGTYIQTYTQT